MTRPTERDFLAIEAPMLLGAVVLVMLGCVIAMIVALIGS